MLQDMKTVQTHWSEQDDRDMVRVRRLARKLNGRGIPASVGRGDYNRPEVRLQCRDCGEWFTPPWTCQSPTSATPATSPAQHRNTGPDQAATGPAEQHPQLPRRNQDAPKEARRHDQQANARPQGLPDRPAQPAHQRRPPAEDPAHPDAARGCQGRAQGPTGRLTEGKPPRNRRRQQPTEGRKRRRSPLTRPRDHRTPPGRRYRRLTPEAGSAPAQDMAPLAHRAP